LNLGSLLLQAEGTDTHLVQLSEGHMSLIENKIETIAAIKSFVRRG
jgi:hypothetical protein